MLNVRNVVVDAYKMIGDIADSEALDGTRSTVGVDLLNQMITKLNLDNMFAFTMQNVNFTPSSSKRSYTIGLPTVAHPTVDINAPRPSNITRLYAKPTSNIAASYEVNKIGLQDLPIFSTEGSGAPLYFAYNSTYPHASIELSSDLSGYDLVICYNTAIPSVQFNDILEIPPEYEPALKYGLAVILAKRYGKEREVIADMSSLRDETYEDIKNNTINKTNITHHLDGFTKADSVMNRGGIY
jgi:hypothetical protein